MESPTKRSVGDTGPFVFLTGGRAVFTDGTGERAGGAAGAVFGEAVAVEGALDTGPFAFFPAGRVDATDAFDERTERAA